MWRARVRYAAGIVVVCACGTTAQLPAPDGGLEEASVDASQPDVGPSVTCTSPNVACDAGLAETCDGCAPPTVLATCQSGPGALALDDANVYWINQGVYASGGGKIPISYKDGTVMKCAKSGCNDSPTTVAAPLTQVWTRTLASSGSALFFSTHVDAGGVGGEWAIVTADETTCTAEPSMWLAGGAYMLAADGANVFFTTYPGCSVYGCAAAGCSQPTLLWAAPAPNMPTTGIAVDATDVYWADEHGDLFRCSKTGCGGKPTLLGQTFWPAIDQVVIDDTNVYADGEPGLVVCAKSGCTTPKALVQNFLWAAAAIATDGVNVYWTTPSSGVFRCPVTGCVTPTQIGTTRGAGSGSIAVDAANVYWSDAASGTIFARAK